MLDDDQNDQPERTERRPAPSGPARRGCRSSRARRDPTYAQGACEEGGRRARPVRCRHSGRRDHGRVVGRRPRGAATPTPRSCGRPPRAGACQEGAGSQERREEDRRDPRPGRCAVPSEVDRSTPPARPTRRPPPPRRRPPRSPPPSAPARKTAAKRTAKKAAAAPEQAADAAETAEVPAEAAGTADAPAAEAATAVLFQAPVVTTTTRRTRKKAAPVPVETVDGETTEAAEATADAEAAAPATPKKRREEVGCEEVHR